jgi:3-oxocholest-4-en-26-oate---CoA ligase
MHFATMWEAIADTKPSAAAVIQGERVVTWAEYDQRAARLSSFFTANRLSVDSKVAMFMFNSPEYLETQYAAVKARMCPINVNYRYLDDELAYLLENADCEAIIFHAGLADRVERVKDRLPKLRVFVQVDDPESPQTELTAGAVNYEVALASHEAAPRQDRNDDDVYMLYTGGTTGMPKGVMYPVGGLTSLFSFIANMNLGRGPFESVHDAVETVGRLEQLGIQMNSMPCCPLMHGTGMWLGAMVTHLTGGTVVLLSDRAFNTTEVFDTIERRRIQSVVIVGDAFARPLVAALRACAESRGAWDLSSLKVIISSGAMFSHDMKAALLDFLPDIKISDLLGSTEGGMGSAHSTKADTSLTAKFGLNPTTRVLDDNDRDVVPGSGQIGRVASPALSLGYYKDAEKSAKTFRMVGDVRYSFPGDVATVESDGSITLLGRGSHCINTGGEKVFPEEVEEAVKTHHAIADCLVFGLDDDRFGQRVVAVASAAVNGAAVDIDDVIAVTKQKLSGYKVPRQLVVVPDVPRAPNGKADYRRARELFLAQS